jgi:hypothetical protein
MLDEAQIRTLEAVANRIIPPDDDPGGWQGGVGDYLFRQFERDLKHLIDDYRHGLTDINAESLAVTGKDFADLAPDAQDALLASIERGEVQTPWQVTPILFFALLVDHCAEGFYSDPGNGGNRDKVAWKLIGFEVRG